MPLEDFNDLVTILKNLDVSIEFKDKAIFSKKECSSLSLQPVYLKLKPHFHLMIPVDAYTKKNGDKDGCLILFEENDEGSRESDSIETPTDGDDFKTNGCYILGLPVIQSFNFIFDFAQNRIGIADKKI